MLFMFTLLSVYATNTTYVLSRLLLKLVIPLNCLGHLLTSEGIAISPDKLIKIQEWPLPRTGKQLASFLGLVTFVRQHVRHFADLTAEFVSLKRSSAEIDWTPQRKHMFELV